jgi:hypothetical protein
MMMMEYYSVHEAEEPSPPSETAHCLFFSTGASTLRISALQSPEIAFRALEFQNFRDRLNSMTSASEGQLT